MLMGKYMILRSDSFTPSQKEWVEKSKKFIFEVDVNFNIICRTKIIYNNCNCCQQCVNRDNCQDYKK